MSAYWLEEFISNPRDYIDSFYQQGKYYQKIRSWDKNNKKRKAPRSYYVFTIDEKEAHKNATFYTYELGIKEHMINRGYLCKASSLLPMCPLKISLLKVAGVKVEEDVFIAPEVTIDPVLRGWIRFKRGSSIGWGTKCFNHLFEEDGKVILGYIEVGEEASIGGFVSISPGVTIGKKANIGAEAKIGPGVSIGDYAKIGAGALLTPFVSVGEGAEVMMGSLVTENVPPHSKVQGNPARIVSEKIRDRKPKLDLIVNPNIESA